jgi:hypothetical protein
MLVLNLPNYMVHAFATISFMYYMICIRIFDIIFSTHLIQVFGIQQTYFHFHTPDVPLIFSPQLPLLAFAGRVLVGIPTILIVKFCSKALSKWLLPVMCNTLGIPIVSPCYVPALKVDNSRSKTDAKQAGYLQKVFSLFPQKAYDVDTGIRFVQYASLAWTVVDLVPAIFTHLNL